MDACLMSMAEVGYQIHQSAQYTVGSEETEPLEGWPYDTILAQLAAHPAMTPKELSSLIVSKYMESYSGDQVTQSACDLSHAEGLATAVTGLAAALTAGLADAGVRQKVLIARTQAQYFDVNDNIDLVDFCALLEQALPGSVIAQRSRDVVHAAKAGYVVSKGAEGPDLRHANGVAIYFPLQSVSPLYAGLDFSKKTGWDGFLKAYLTAVRGR
jgi:hypothetical protein